MIRRKGYTRPVSVEIIAASALYWCGESALMSSLKVCATFALPVRRSRCAVSCFV